MLNKLSDAAMLFGLTISLNKTEVLYQSMPNTILVEPNIIIDDAQLTNINSFKYLRCILLSNGILDQETEFRIRRPDRF